MTIAKGLTSGYVPMSASVISEAIWDVLREGSPEVGVFAHGYTYSAHPVAAAAGLANLDIMEREDLVGNARDVGGYMQERLRTALADHPLVGEVRGIGLIAGVELVADKRRKIPFDPKAQAGQRAAAIALEEGVVTRALNNTLAFSPPLVMTRSDVDEMVAAMERTLDRTRRQFSADGLWEAA